MGREEEGGEVTAPSCFYRDAGCTCTGQGDAAPAGAGRALLQPTGLVAAPSRAGGPGCTLGGRMLKGREASQLHTTATLLLVVFPRFSALNLFFSPNLQRRCWGESQEGCRVRASGLLHGSFSPSSAQLSTKKPFIYFFPPRKGQK